MQSRNHIAAEWEVNIRKTEDEDTRRSNLPNLAGLQGTPTSLESLASLASIAI